MIALPADGKRYELVDGELLVTEYVSPLHQIAIMELYRPLREYVDDHGRGEVYLGPADVELDLRTLVKPDVFVVPLIDGRRLREWSDIKGRLLLVAEVLSPATARADRYTKRRRYQRAGVPECWIVDLDARLIERWRPDDERPEVLSDQLEWRLAGAAESLVIDLSALFGEVLDR